VLVAIDPLGVEKAQEWFIQRPLLQLQHFRDMSIDPKVRPRIGISSSQLRRPFQPSNLLAHPDIRHDPPLPHLSPGRKVYGNQGGEQLKTAAIVRKTDELIRGI
jgi:hypothetical protein